MSPNTSMIEGVQEGKLAMGIPRPTGEYAGQMLDPGGWPEANEDAFYDRAQEYNQVLRKVTDVMDSTRRQQVEVFEGGVWSGGAANAANGALGANVNQMGTLQDYLATVITWHQHIAGLVAQAKADIGDNVDGAQREISILENDTELDAEERAAAISALVRQTHAANASLVSETAEQVLASKNWKPPHNALTDLLHQVTPAAPEVPTLVVPTPDGSAPVTPAPTPFEPTPANPYPPNSPGAPSNPVTPTPFEPTPANPYPPNTPGAPVNPVTPGAPGTPISPGIPSAPVMPTNPATPVTPGAPVPPVTPAKPKPETPTPPVAPGGPVGPGTPTPGDVKPAPVTPGPGPSPQPGPLPPSPGQPSMPQGPGTPSTPSAPGTDPAHVKPAATAPSASPTHPTAGPSAPSRGDDGSSPAVAPAAAAGIPPASRAGSAGPGAAAASAGAAPGQATSSGAGAASRPASGRAPTGPSGRAPTNASVRSAAARNAPPAHPAPPPARDDRGKDKNEAADITPGPSVPVSAARAARDAAAAATRRSAKDDPLRLARRIAAALNAPDIANADDYGFHWITAVTTDGEIVVANSYGLAYIPERVQLPNKVYLASADRTIPPDENARCATYPILAVQNWVTYHDLKLRAVIGTAEQLANSDPGAAKIVLEPEDIPESGAKMIGRTRLEVVDPSAAAQLAETEDLRLTDLLPPAPADENPPDDERHMRWFELMKPMTSTATGREKAHLRAFHAFAAHSQELALHHAYGAAEPEAQRSAVEEFLYWRYVAGLLETALSEPS